MWYSPYCDTQQKPPVAHCSVCHGEIYIADWCELDENRIFCEHCATEYPDNSRVAMRGDTLDNYLNQRFGGNHDE